MTSKHDYIQEAAYFIWLNRGKPEGQDLEIWDEATKIYELTQEVLKPVAKKEAKAPAKKVAAKKSVKKVAKKSPAKKAVKVVKAEAPKVEPKAKTVAPKKATVKKAVAKKATAKKTVAKKSPAKKSIKVAVKPAVKPVEIAKIIPMVKKEAPAKKATTPKTKIKIVVGRKK